MFKLVVAALSAVGPPSCAAPDAAPAQPPQAALSSDAGPLVRLFETLGACDRFAPPGDRAFPAHLRRHAPSADEAGRRALRAAYDRGASPAVASRQTPETCAVALRGHSQEAPGPHGRPDARRDDRPLASPGG